MMDTNYIKKMAQGNIITTRERIGIMENFNLTIESDIILSEMLCLAQYGNKDYNLPGYLYVTIEDMEDYVCEFKNILIKYYLSDYFDDAMNKYLNKIIERNVKSY